MNTLPELWGLNRLIGEPTPGADPAVNKLLTDPGLSPATREVLNAVFLIAGYTDPAAAEEAGVPRQASVTGYARTMLAGHQAKDLADATMRGVDRGRIRIPAGAGRALDLSYERLFGLTRAEQSAQFRTPAAVLDRLD